MTTTTDSTLIDQAVIDGLRPQARRYDVAVSDGLVLAVLPNGCKTWTWVYDRDRQAYRQTLGVYPEMSLEQARQAQASAARTQRRREAPVAYVIRDGRIEPTPQTPNWKWPLAGAIGILVAGILLGWLVIGGGQAPGPAGLADRERRTTDVGGRQGQATDPDRVAVAPQPPAAAETVSVASNPDAGTQTALPQPETAIAEALAPATLPVSDPLAADTSAVTVVPPPEAKAPVEGAAAPSQTATMPAQTVPPQPETDNVEARVSATRDAAVADRLATAAAPPPEVTSVPVAPAPPQPEPVPVQTAATPLPTSSTTADPVIAPAAADTADAIVGARISPQTDYQPGVRDARVARAQVTTAVVGREPVDALGPILVGTGEDIQTYYFFTELRSLGGQRVRHRWIAGDRIQAEIPFNVGEAWRWRVFSSKRLLASLAGPWRVQIVTDDNTVIYDYGFEFQP